MGFFVCMTSLSIFNYRSTFCEVKSMAYDFYTKYKMVLLRNYDDPLSKKWSL